MDIYIGADHRGFELKKLLTDWLKKDHKIFDMGNIVYNPKDDYPDFSIKVANAVAKDKKSKGILICGSGVGVCIAANRFKNIRAFNTSDKKIIKQSREDDDTNVLCLSGDYLNLDEAKELITLWLETPFLKKDHFVRRIKKIDES
jgi:ribose 5-phosphate isomerase B